MTIDITSINNSLTALTDWVRAGFEKQNNQVEALNDRYKVGIFTTDNDEFEGMKDAAQSQSSILSQVIYRLDTGEVYIKSGSDWVISTDFSVTDLGEDTFLFNFVNGKSYYLGPNQMVFDMKSKLLTP